MCTREFNNTMDADLKCCMYHNFEFYNSNFIAVNLFEFNVTIKIILE